MYDNSCRCLLSFVVVIFNREIDRHVPRVYVQSFLIRACTSSGTANVNIEYVTVESNTMLYSTCSLISTFIEQKSNDDLLSSIGSTHGIDLLAVHVHFSGFLFTHCTMRKSIIMNIFNVLCHSIDRNAHTR
jgi:hypothetical protein